VNGTTASVGSAFMELVHVDDGWRTTATGAMKCNGGGASTGGGSGRRPSVVHSACRSARITDGSRAGVRGGSAGGSTTARGASWTEANGCGGAASTATSLAAACASGSELDANDGMTGCTE
jgi:hypothetical protein